MLILIEPSPNSCYAALRTRYPLTETNTMKTQILIIMLLMSATLLAEDLTTLSGKKYTGVTINRAEADGISISHGGGLAKIPFSDLSPELQKKYNYEPEKAAAYAAAMAKAQEVAAHRAKLEAGVAAAKAKLAAAEARLPIYKMEAKILQMTDEGAIVSASVTDEQGMLPLPEPVFVFGISNKLHVDGDHWKGTVWYAGNYHYNTAVSGAAKSVRAFSTDREDALKRVRSTLGIK